MGTRISDCFRRMIEGIQPSESDVSRAEKHRATIQRRLEQSFNLNRFDLVGSYSRETAVRSLSDVDFFAVLSREDARWGGAYIGSDTFLEKIRKDLQERFWQTQVSRDAQAVVLRFADDSFRVDVAPAIFERVEDLRPVFQMPDGQGGWMLTSPRLHKDYLSKANRRSWNRLRRVAQIIKFWRSCRMPPVALSSFHVEMLMAANNTCGVGQSYGRCLFNAFHLLAKRGCVALRDPVGISGVVAAVKTDAQRDATCRAVEYATEHAARALCAENDGNLRDAWEQWRIVFNGQFPR